MYPGFPSLLPCRCFRRWWAAVLLGAALSLAAQDPPPAATEADPAALPERIDALMEARQWEAVMPLARRWIAVLEKETARKQDADQARAVGQALAQARHVLGSTQDRAGDAAAAVETFAAAWRDYERAGAAALEKAACADEAARAALAAGQLAEAERWLRLALDQHTAPGPARALARVQLAEGLTKNGRPADALRELDAAATEAGDDPAAHWAIARMRGVLAHTLGHYQDALASFAVARQLADSIPDANVLALRSALDAQAGQTLFRLGRLEEAEEALVSAEAWFRRRPDDLETWSACVNNLAAFWLATGQAEPARKRLVEILAHASASEVERLRRPTALLVPWLNLAAAELACGRREAAATALAEAAVRAESLPDTHPLRAQLALARFAWRHTDPATPPAETLAAARAASDQARAWLGQLAATGGGEEQWLEFRRTLDPVSPLAAVAAEVPDAVPLLADAVFATQGLVLEQRLQPAGTAVSGDDPLPDTLSWEETAAALPDEAVLVNYVWWRPLDARGSWARHGRYGALVLRKHHSPRWIDLGPAEEIEARTRRVIAAARDTVAANEATRRRASLDFQLESLWEWVWGKIEPEVGDARHLLLRPDGMLHFVPWAILRAPEDRGAATTAAEPDARFFCQHYPHVTLLARPRPAAPAPNHPADPSVWRVLAVPDAPGRDAPPPPASMTWPVSRELWTDLLAMPALPGVTRETHAIRAAAESRALTVETPPATPGALTRLPAPSVLHFCGHGFALEENAFGASSLQAGLVLDDCAATLRALAARQPVLPERDGLFFAHEAAALPLRGTSLVVLSGCQTGLGHWQPGEHLEGLRHAFIVAGARHVAATLWDVNDAATPEFIGAFYQRLARGEMPAAALWATQRAWLESDRPAHLAVRAALAGTWTLEAAGW